MTATAKAKIKEYKPTNKQGVRPDPRKLHHLQGLTCDCKQCGKEFVQFHEGHILCSQECGWKHRGVETVVRACGDCGCEDVAPAKPRGYRCTSCTKLKLNSTRTDVVRRG
jgi:hypothetical protein